MDVWNALLGSGWQERIHEQKQRIPTDWDALLFMAGVADEGEKCTD